MFWVFILLFSGALLVFSFLYLWRKNRKYKKREEYVGKELIELHRTEQERQIYIPTVNTITFFEGEIDSETIQERLVQIVKANPWLCSRLVTISEGIGINSIALCHDPAQSMTRANIILDHYVEKEINNDELRSDSRIYEGCPMDSILSKFSHLFVKRGVDSLDKPEEVLFRTIVFKIIEHQKISRFALIISMGHTLIDGHSYYQIYNMFDHNAPIRSYTAKRVLDFPQKIINITGLEMQNYLKSNLFLFAALFWKFCFPSRKHTLLFRIDKNRIEEMKKQRQSKTSATCSFISTNDIVTSTFFRTVQANYGMMPMNYRNRLEGVTDTLIGNYQSNILFQEASFRTPEAIREIVNHYDRKKQKIPTILETLQFRFAMVTNWSTFVKEIAITPTNKFIYHSPIQPLIVVDALILFQSRSNELCAYIMCDQRLTRDYWLEQFSFFAQ